MIHGAVKKNSHIGTPGFSQYLRGSRFSGNGSRIPSTRMDTRLKFLFRIGFSRDT